MNNITKLKDILKEVGEAGVELGILHTLTSWGNCLSSIWKSHWKSLMDHIL